MAGQQAAAKAAGHFCAFYPDRWYISLLLPWLHSVPQNGAVGVVSVRSQQNHGAQHSKSVQYIEYKRHASAVSTIARQSGRVPP